MLAKRIIPCLDVKDGRVVKGVHFKDLTDSGDPIELASRYVRQGADELVLLDVAATTEERKHRVELIKKVSKAISIPFAVGGGISRLEHISELLDAGADKVSIGSSAVTDPEFVKRACDKFGSQAIIISLDCKKTESNWEIYIRSGQHNTHVDAIELAVKMEKLGAGELLVNSLDRDGTNKGFDVELLKLVSASVRIPVIASSGAGSVEDFVEVFRSSEVTGALGASVFHTGKFTVGDIKAKLKKEGIEVRS